VECCCWQVSGRQTEWYGTIVIPARAIARLYSTEAQRGSTPARRMSEPVMQSRVGCHWLLPTSNPLSSLCSEQASHVVSRTPIQLGVRALLLASERASALTSLCSPRKAVASGRACRLVARLTKAKYHRQTLSPAHTNTAYRVPVSSSYLPPLHKVASFFLPRASTCCHACSPRRAITG